MPSGLPGTGTIHTKACEGCPTGIVRATEPGKLRAKRFCSLSCASRNQSQDSRRRGIAKRATTVIVRRQRACDGCSTPFTPTTSTHRYCLTCAPTHLARRRILRYGVTQPQWDALVAKQGGTCALCPAEPTDVDHCHATGVVRGALCRQCNLRLATLESEWASRAGDYLRFAAT